MSANTGAILEDIDRKILNLQTSMMTLNKQKHKRKISEETYSAKALSIGSEIDKLIEVRTSYNEKSCKQAYSNFRIEAIASEIKNLDIFDTFNEHMFRKLISQVLIINPLQVEFDFKGIKRLELL